MRRFRIHAAARVEFDEACKFLEGRRPGVGKRFRRAVLETLRSIIADPRQSSPRGRFRKRLVPVFKYKIYYELSDEMLRIVAIAHPSQRPGYWKDRILDEQR
jgi:plasmid stabilization system protein ParE